MTTLAEATVRFGSSAHAVYRELERIMLARGADGRGGLLVDGAGQLHPEVEGELAARLGGRTGAGRSRSG